ncbi:MAG TPA: hypothetical protein VMU77_05585, partial [Acidimicrobiales bacterium]|nr:hypothetical protein [Acidimicrobiales bacterium]
MVLLVGVCAVAALLASCTGPAVIAAPGTLISYDQLGAVYANGNLPTPNPATVCGSSTATFLSELQNTNPLQAKVPLHWGDIVSGKDMMVQGTVESPYLGNLDLPFDHPFGGDMTFDVKLDRPFYPLGGAYGANAGDPDINGVQPQDVVHVELEAGLLPHIASTPGPASGQNWQDSANADTANLMPGFMPQSGDRVLVLGRWVLDCGHNDFNTEIHPATFIAVARTTGSTTQIFTFYNPYHESQLYNPDPTVVSNVADATRLTSSDTQPFPAYLVSEILRLAHIGDPGSAAGYPSTFLAPSVEVANTDSPVQWYACAPTGPGSSTTTSSSTT